MIDAHDYRQHQTTATSPTQAALLEAIAVLKAVGCPGGPDTIRTLQDIVDQRGCEEFDTAGDGSLTDLIDIIIRG